MQAITRIWTPVDFNAEGKQTDCLRLPHSTDVSAYGWIPIPLVCIRNGEGPTALLVSGNHGDEYEGQVALLNLARMISPSDLRGRLIILPALNYPAVVAGRRVSPIDEGNLNRMFPGGAFGSPTQMIAHYVSEVLFPLADVVIDLHSGGRSLQYVPSALVRPGRTDEESARLRKLLEVFGAPISFVTDGAGGGGLTTLAAAAQDKNIPALTTELGGGSTLSRNGLELAEQGIRRVLKHCGILPRIVIEKARATRVMKVAGRSAFVYARSRGIFEPAAKLGEEVQAGQVAGSIHHFDWPMRPPETLHFEASGVVACRRAPSLTNPGDCLFKVMADAG
ncbi:succinylglutamate desuccinylase/aspartoacylase family protein [Pseudaminobacter sp. NGMCC 1.201702]|uniref:succinylglutamate desuccinylase/aspartoacylase family protein n=1 Tax=Pseudaminobacter sp. NGMCC 1.201702 TaxID=3391825 RepID=UPI0039F03C94